jgi:glycosyltransferase involved in cell wall biosynthesis
MSSLLTRKVLLVHPRPDAMGGAEAVAARILVWLLSHQDVEVTLLTLAPVDWKKLEAVAGKPLPRERLVNRIAAVPGLVSRFAGGLTLLKIAFLHRTAKQYARDFDLCIGAHGEIDFGRPGFQYVHHPAFAPKRFLRRYGVFVGKSVVDRVRVAESLYRVVLFLVSGDRRRGFRRNVTAVNSHFMRKFVREVYGLEADVVYPVFLKKEKLGGLPWEQRRFRLVALGRIAPDKGYAGLIDIFARVQRKYPAAEFLIMGESADPVYEESLREHARAAGVAVSFEPNAGSTQVWETLSSSMFFVHGRKFEHFGIAILEAVAAGCLAFVHDSGGQTEIVRSPLLRYKEPADVVQGMELLLQDAGVRNRTVKELRHTAEEFLGRDFGKELERVLLPLWDVRAPGLVDPAKDRPAQ